MQGNYFKPLTGIRALAAYMVFLHHIPDLSALKIQGLAGAFFHELHIGVTVFFVLSGFLITYRYWNTIKINKDALKTYLVNRFARIFPAYAILTCCAFVFIFHNQGITPESIASFILNITLLRGFSEQFRFSGIAQGWSLTVEETFYFSAPFLFYFVRKLKLRFYPVVLAGYVLATLGIGVALTMLFHAQWLGFFFENYIFLFSATFFGRSFEFAVGAGLALFLFKKQETIAVSKRNVGKHSYYTHAGLLGMLLVIAGLMMVTNKYAAGSSVSHPLGLVLNNIALPICITILFYGLLHEKNVIVRILSQPLTSLLGKSSYSFYLLHMGFITTEIGLRVSLNSPFRVGVLFVFMVLLSIGFYYFIEEPANNKIRAMYQRLSTPKVLTVSGD